MARPTKLEQAAKLKLAEKNLQKQPDATKAKPAKESEIAEITNVDITHNKADITIVNVSNDNEVLKLLDLQDKQDAEKLKKAVIQQAGVPVAPQKNLAKGMVSYYDTKLGRHFTEKESILKSMMKFNPSRYKLA